MRRRSSKGHFAVALAVFEFSVEEMDFLVLVEFYSVL